jgi:hypothetical protein
MKIIKKERINGKIKKKYEIEIPVNRVLKIESLDNQTKEKLINLRNRIDLVKLTKMIVYLKEKLEKVYNEKRRKQCLIKM